VALDSRFRENERRKVIGRSKLCGSARKIDGLMSKSIAI